ncbi:hypothetical protein B0H15DRAFT_834388 [Mycena belliarum]|uniref:F-box domain-containing protein n=1 Tax=Mycena belliarum TaxID=1033014 RepID=A0AAD6U5K0_9AGAR|nr:hypothetical protein B0H15DRAFT_834388 [Mycena belliae]
MLSVVAPAVELNSQVARLRLVLRDYVALHCPASRLPIELWDLIFQECVPHPAEPSLRDAPVNLSQVCRRWRNIALSNPALWSTIAITTTRSHSERGTALEPLHRMLQLWLRRSGTRALSVSLSQSDTVKSPGPISLLLDAVLAHATHLRSLEVRAPELCLFPFASHTLHLPVLEHLKIDTPWPRLAAPGFALPLDSAPRLRTLSLLDATFAAAHISVFDATRLTELTLLPHARAPPEVYWNSDDALTLLAEATHLRSLRLAINDVMPRRRTLAHAPVLRSLSLEFRDAFTSVPQRATRIGALFSLLYTPALQLLALLDRGAAHGGPLNPLLYAWPQAQFLAFLGATPLRVLHLEALPLYQTQIVEALQRTPRLTALVLAARARGSQRSVGDTLLAALTVLPLAPALRRVEFRHCGTRCTEQALIEMVEARRGALQYLRVHRSALPSKDLVTRLARWNTVADLQY